jgi:hypothetical protein
VFSANKRVNYSALKGGWLIDPFYKCSKNEIENLKVLVQFGNIN